LPVLPIDQLPAVPAINAAAGEVEIDREELLAALKQVLFAASREHTRYYLNGILLHDEGDQMILVATDGHRLARRQIASAPFSVDRRCIVPVTSIPAITRLLARATTERVKLRRSNTLFEVNASGFVLTTKLIDGTFPDYVRVIPAAPKNSVVVDRADLVGALERVGAVIEHGKLAALVGLAWNSAEPVLRLSLPHQPGVADDVIAATVTGNSSIQTAAQVAHVVELFNELRGENVCIATDGAGNPVVITDPEDGAGQFLQMPCRIPLSSMRAA
jgi:DNA polymerase-3 subunit beta